MIFACDLVVACSAYHKAAIFAVKRLLCRDCNRYRKAFRSVLVALKTVDDITHEQLGWEDSKHSDGFPGGFSAFHSISISRFRVFQLIAFILWAATVSNVIIRLVTSINLETNCLHYGCHSDNHVTDRVTLCEMRSQSL